jgi:phage gpG-like protein
MAKDFDQGDKMRRWTVNLENPQVALKQIGALMVSESQRAFEKQRFGEEGWRPRAVPNIAGVISDFHAGKRAPEQRRFQARKALIDTGALVASFIAKVSGDAVVAGTAKTYAEKLHRGGKSETLPITEKVQRLLGNWLKGKGSVWNDKLGFLLNPMFTDETRKFKIPKRPLVGLTRQTEEDILELIGVEVMEVD